MKIFLMTDLEGVAGILNYDDWATPEGRYFDKAQRLLTEEVNAAVDGFCKNGAMEIVVFDGHGYGGIDAEILDERAQLIHGHDGKGWPLGLDQSFSGLAFVGQHAKAGTPYSHLTHTQWFNYIDLAINHVSIGEYGQMAFCAMELGVPTIFACGEKALAVEAKSLTPGVVTVAVKQGLSGHNYDELDTDSYRNATLSAIHLAPKRARKAIREGALQAINKLRHDPSSFHYPKINPPYVRSARFRRDGDTPPYRAHDEHSLSIIALLNMPFTPVK